MTAVTLTAAEVDAINAALALYEATLDDYRDQYTAAQFAKLEEALKSARRKIRDTGLVS